MEQNCSYVARANVKLEAPQYAWGRQRCRQFDPKNLVNINNKS